jgi:glycosyltransferase involved in cell wall biosynthesis
VDEDLAAVDEPAARARLADVVYTTGMFGRSSLGTLLARTPFVVKLTADPAYERGRRWGVWRGSLDEFQHAPSAASLPLRLARDFDVRRAAHVVTPSSYLRELAVGWGVAPERVTVLPNPAPPVPELPPRPELRRTYGLDGPTLVFAGRLTAQKSLELAIEAARRAGVALVIAGDGPDRAALERLGHARFLGPLPRERVLELFRAGDASLLSSSWENFPHTVVEALAVGTPVIATRTGGVEEVVRNGENGLVVEPNDVDALTRAIERFFFDPALAGELADLRTVVRDAAGRLRRLLFDLAPPNLQRSLADAIGGYAAGLASEAGFAVELVDEGAERLPHAQRVLVYRLAQEALINVAKHARATRVDVRLRSSPTGFLLVVEDDGVGFDPVAAQREAPRHLGLTFLRQRAESAGGQLRLRAAAGRGTRIEAWLPPPTPDEAR